MDKDNIKSYALLLHEDDPKLPGRSKNDHKTMMNLFKTRGSIFVEEKDGKTLRDKEGKGDPIIKECEGEKGKQNF